jgi:hypothetical protein
MHTYTNVELSGCQMQIIIFTEHDISLKVRQSYLRRYIIFTECVNG